MKEQILRKIHTRSARIGILGLGYVGLPLAMEFAAAGFQTTGFEIDTKKVKRIINGESYIADAPASQLKQLVQCGLLSATSDLTRLRNLDIIIICVPTPLDDHQQPDISFIQQAGQSIGAVLTAGMTVILESTTYPGTTEELLRPLLEKESGLCCVKEFYLGFSPERVDPGNQIFKIKNTPKIVGAIGAEATESIAALYQSILEQPVHTVSSPAVAEMEKIFENIYRNINIGLVNEMAMLCHQMGISIWEVIEAAKTKPYGFQAFYPGPGLGGHCIPLDPYYLAWKAKEYCFHTSMLESSMMINDQMPAYCVQRISQALNRYRRALNGSTLLVLGVAYKPDLADCRESPALRVVEELEKSGALVHYYDPFVAACSHRGVDRTSLKQLTPAVVQSADMVIVACGHKKIDYAMVQRNAACVFDTQNAMATIFPRENIEVL